MKSRIPSYKTDRGFWCEFLSEEYGKIDTVEIMVPTLDRSVDEFIRLTKEDIEDIAEIFRYRNNEK